MLQLGAAKIQELEAVQPALEDAEEPRRLAARQRFLENLWLVRRMANGQPIYETVEGVDYIMRAPDETSDRRIEALERLAKKLGLARADVDAETDRILAIEESDRARVEQLAAEFMAKLPPTPTRWVAPPPGDRRSWRRVVNYDGSAIDAVAAVLPERRLVWTERNELGEQLLDDTDAHLRHADVAEGPAPSTRDTPARRASMLVAACEIAGKYDRDRRAAIKRKSAILLAEFPRGAGDGTRYAARSSDLDAELIQPLQEGLARFSRMVIKLAVKVAAVDTWPVGVTKFERAMALGRTLAVDDSDLANARASLGVARLEPKQEEPVR